MNCIVSLTGKEKLLYWCGLVFGHIRQVLITRSSACTLHPITKLLLSFPCRVLAISGIDKHNFARAHGLTRSDLVFVLKNFGLRRDTAAKITIGLYIEVSLH